jgi:hypothetical protein
MQEFIMSQSVLQIGAPAPAFNLTAIGSGRQVGPTIGPGRALMLVFHDQNTADIIQKMQVKVRALYADADQLLIASVVNMSSVPRFLRPVAESVMKGSYAKAEAAMPQGLDAADYVVILTDWDGNVSKAYGAIKVDKHPLLVLLDGEGVVRGVHQGTSLHQPALEMLSQVVS